MAVTASNPYEILIYPVEKTRSCIMLYERLIPMTDESHSALNITRGDKLCNTVHGKKRLNGKLAMSS